MWRWGVFGLILFGLVSALILHVLNQGKPQPWIAQRQTQQLRPIVPELHKLRLQHYYWKTGGRHLHYSRGDYADPDSSWTRAAPTRIKPFDEQAERDYQLVVRLLSDSGVAVSGVSLDSGHWEFHLDRGAFTRVSYILDPGYRQLPLDQGTELRYEAIDSDWYLLDEDFN